MNEKIKDLAKQSGFYFYDLHDIDGQDLGETIEADSWSCAEKFAELIIKESIIDFYRRYLDTTSNEDITVQVDRYIKNHFGVE